VLDPAEPAEEQRRQPPWNAIGDEELDLFRDHAVAA
jgi:hypothetical protein